MNNIIIKIKDKIPNDWLFKILSSTMTTALSFYLFQFANQIEFVKSFWDYNDKNFIRTFLLLQILVGIVFYFILKACFIKVFMNLFVDQFIKIGKNLEMSDLREISKAKSFLVSLFDLNIIDPRELDSLEVAATDRTKIIKEFIDDLGKWASLFIQFTVVFILVYKLSAWYILPLLVIALVIMILFGFAVSVFVHSIPILNKIRCELASKKEEVL